MRPSMQLSAVSTPAAIWLCTGPDVMLSTKLRSLSRSAYFRLSRKAPLAANFPSPGTLDVDSCHSHAWAPVIWTGPEYGTAADPLLPNSFRPASNRPSLPNWVDANEKWMSPG